MKPFAGGSDAAKRGPANGHPTANPAPANGGRSLTCRSVASLRVSSWARILTFLALMCCSEAWSQEIRKFIQQKTITESEWRLLPEWCIDSQEGPYGGPEGSTQLNRSPRAAHWVSLMGTDFWHMHHYCRGLRDLIRLRRADLNRGERTFLMDRAIDEFNYIIVNAKRTMPLQPEVLFKQGEVFVMKKDYPGASAAFAMSRELMPSYWPAYASWFDVLLELKQYDAAAKLIEAGLANAPGNPELVQRRERLSASRGGRSGHTRTQRAAAEHSGGMTSGIKPVAEAASAAASTTR